MKKNSPEQIEKLELEINGEIPEYIKILSYQVIKVRVGSDWEGYKWHAITFDDVVKYLKYESSSLSGVRRLGTILGDWRNIDVLGSNLWDIFARLNDRNECRKVFERV